MFDVKGVPVHNQAELCNSSSKSLSKCKNEIPKMHGNHVCLQVKFRRSMQFLGDTYSVNHPEMSSNRLQNVWKYHHYSFEYIVNNVHNAFLLCKYSVFCTTNEGRLWFFIIVSQHGIVIIMNHEMQDTTERTARRIERIKKTANTSFSW